MKSMGLGLSLTAMNVAQAQVREGATKVFVSFASICAAIMVGFMRIAAWWVVLAQIVGLGLAVKKGGHQSLDTFASLPEEQWFDPGANLDSVQAFIETWSGQLFDQNFAYLSSRLRAYDIFIIFLDNGVRSCG